VVFVAGGRLVVVGDPVVVVVGSELGVQAAATMANTTLTAT
jgi:hypothetical protein